MNKLIKYCIISVLLSSCVANPQTPAIDTSSLTRPSATPIPATQSAEKPATTHTATQPVATTAAPQDSPTSSPTSPDLTHTPTLANFPNGNIIADHTVVNRFTQIPDTAIQAASRLTLLMRHASVGQNIYLGLTCIWGNFPDRRPAACGEFFDLKYDPSNWIFENRGNPGWPGKVEDFVTQVNQRSNDFEVLSFAVDYVDGLDSGDARPISDPEIFQSRFIDRLEALEADHPEKIFIWWTMSLPRLGHDNRDKFNEMLRAYALEHNKILFDIADIEAHDPDGNLITDDAGHEIIYEGYTNESRSGHLNEAGRERVARAFWWIMARIAGWDG